MNAHHSLSFALAIALVGCSAPRSPASPSDVRPTAMVRTSGRVSLTSFALAGRITAESARTVGSTIGGFVSGGTAGAESSWAAGASHTREVARREADVVKQAANEP